MDVFVFAWVGLFALSGFARGLVAQVLALVGVVAGLLVGAWLAPHIVGADGSAWVPLASLVGAAAGALAFGLATGRLAATTNVLLTARPALRTVDRAGGAVGGALVGLALAWAAAILFLHQPALGLRTAVQESTILPRLVRAVPPEPVLRALDRFDPLPLLPQLAPRGLPEPDASVLRRPGTRAAAGSVLKIEGTSCGLGVQGSGWVVRPGVVATNAHVVSGQRDTTVSVPGGSRREATIVYVDGRNDVALLRVEGLGAPALKIARGGPYPRDVAVLGYPQDGALTATAATAGRPRTVLAPDAYEGRVAPRRVVPLRGRVRPGESGAPVVDERGRVVAMIFGGSRRGAGGFAVPVDLVARAVARPLEPVAPGPCVG